MLYHFGCPACITFILIHSSTTYIDTSLKVISVKSKQALVREINGLQSSIIRYSSYPVSRNKNEDVSVNTTKSQRDMNTSLVSLYKRIVGAR